MRHAHRFKARSSHIWGQAAQMLKIRLLRPIVRAAQMLKMRPLRPVLVISQMLKIRPMGPILVISGAGQPRCSNVVGRATFCTYAKTAHDFLHLCQTVHDFFWHAGLDLRFPTLAWETEVHSDRMNYKRPGPLKRPQLAATSVSKKASTGLSEWASRAGLELQVALGCPSKPNSTGPFRSHAERHFIFWCQGLPYPRALTLSILFRGREVNEKTVNVHWAWPAISGARPLKHPKST